MDKVETRLESPEFEEFCQRRLPDHLRRPVEGMVGLEAELETHRSECRRTWNLYISNGFTPAELCGRAGWPGSTVGGLASRPLRSEVPEAACRAAEGVLRQLRDRRLDESFPVPLLVRLEEAARGVYSSDENSLRNAVNTGRTAVSTHDAGLASAARVEAALLEIVVHPTGQVGIGFGRKWKPGVHKLTVDDLAELREWEARMEGKAPPHNVRHSTHREGHPTPEGFERNWPPYTVVEPEPL